MDESKRHRVDEWIELNLYALLEKSMDEKKFPDSPALTTLIQMYHAVQLRKVKEELSSLWRLFADGDAGVYVGHIGGEVDVDVRRMPEEKPPASPQPLKRTAQAKQKNV